MSTSPPAPALRAVLVAPSESAEGTAPPPAPGGGDQPSQTAADGTGTSTSPPSAPFPHLPSSCLAALLNYLPFQDVRQCLLAGKVMAVNAAHEVETLNITKASEMVGPVVTVRRFPNVSDLNILSILSRRINYSDKGLDLVLNANAIKRVVPFMVQFPKLRGVVLGGMDNEDLGEWPCYGIKAIRPHDHRIVFHGLIEELCGAFDDQHLTPSLELRRFRSSGRFELFESIPPRRSRHCFCREIIASFPIQFVADILSSRAWICKHECCIPMMDQLKVFAKRRGGKEFLRTDEGKDLITEIAGRRIRFNDGLISPSSSDHNLVPVVDAFLKKMDGLGAEVPGLRVLCVRFMTQGSIRRLRESIALIFDSSIDEIPPHLFGTREPRVGHCDNKKEIVVRQTFDALVSCGFRLNPQDYILVDVSEEPALARLRGKIERDEEYA